MEEEDAAGQDHSLHPPIPAFFVAEITSATPAECLSYTKSKIVSTPMRIDEHLEPDELNLTRRQHFFLAAWFNMVHRSSLDSYRVRVMNPVNILDEFLKMYEPHADDRDRRMVAEELIEIFDDHPVIQKHVPHYDMIAATQSLLRRATGATEKDKSIFKSEEALIKSFLRELRARIRTHFITDCFEWLKIQLNEDPDNVTDEQRAAEQDKIERVCRDLLSSAYDSGFTLETLHAVYRMMSVLQIKGTPIAGDEPPYIFFDRLERARSILLDAPRAFTVVFSISGFPSPISEAEGRYGSITMSAQAPQCLARAPADLVAQSRWTKGWAANNQRLFAEVSITSKDARSAGMQAHRMIGQLLDLVRFEFGAENLNLSKEFVAIDGEKLMLLPVPELIPNPKAIRSASDLRAFVEQLNSIGERDEAYAESKDRMLAAFRFYRIGTSVSMFENKLVNWWTAIENLTRSGKPGSIGATVEEALVPILGLAHLNKHMGAIRAGLLVKDQPLASNGDVIDLSQASNRDVFSLLRDPAKRQALLTAYQGEPYLWHHIYRISSSIKGGPELANFINAHEKRFRWQIQRIYRARCDIVHSAQNIGVIGLLCANLEYYLRIVLSAMLVSFKDISTLLGPNEFFARQSYGHKQMIEGLTQRGAANMDVLESTLEK